MPLIALIAVALAVGFELLVESRFGPMGAIGFAILAIGIKAKNTAVSSVGAVILVALLAQSS
ncbi:hypothetical protein U9R90_29830 [Streptomyces sp. E11-3]|uniref:hypothetical protein n=1 Tax=Streptomyces sp. E11-3 TaxID=3110112 RepID=UPI0039815FB3